MSKRRKYKKIQLQTNIRPDKLEPGAAPIIISQTVRGGLDVGDYMAAFKSAESVDLPNRSKLLDIIDEAMTDAHLYAVVQKRKSAVLNSPIEFTRNGVPDDLIGEQLRSPWFQRLLNDILDIEQFGNTLLQFRREGQWLNYDMIPRKHYCPIRRIIIQRQTDITGESFDNFSDLVLLGSPRDLGLLTKAALYVIYKRNALSDFAQFVELYGHPLKEGTYNAYDAEVRKKLTNDLYESGGSSVVVHPEGTNLTIHDTNNKNATGQLYEGFMQFCNDELSKLELGNTLTTEVGEKGTQALGTVHQAGEDKITQISKQLVLNVLNYELTDVFTNLGFNTAGGEFTFANPQVKDLSARIQIDLQLQAMGLKIPEAYLYETYGIPKPENGEEVTNKEPTPEDDPAAASPKEAPEIKPDPEEEKSNKSAQQKVDEKKERSFKNWVSGLFVRKPKPTAFRGKMNALYRGAAKEVESSFVFDADALKKTLIRIYEKDFNPMTEIELNLFNAIWDSLNIATEEGFAAVMVDREREFLTQLKQNNAVFAAFKTHRMQNEIAAELLDSSGILKTFAQFKKDTESLVDHHVDAWLQTEYDTAVIRAHQAADWKQFIAEKDVLPNVKWNPTTSLNPGLDHMVFWNRIWSIDDPFLEKHRPGDRWNCKCSLSSTDELVTDNSDLVADGEKPSPGLGGNPGVTGQIFSDDHPYFTDAYKGADKAVAGLLASLSKE
ncbi:DUF935 family protein [uncultured Culturomica sp.]|uniref:phage portal protein family protein n=1 Tax=uncultured Culturomica sp. TaxID=1926654 RepID=UPI00033FE263|nr:DUF935 family protein [uncultured Culturomica sp.]CCZ10507.1 uncharacterized protein BN783_01631 [Odoribacter sp. CAG:788]